MPFPFQRRASPPVVEVNLGDGNPRPMSRSSSRADKLRVSLVHLSRYFARPKSAFSAPSLSSSLSSRSSDDSNRSFDMPKGTGGEKIVLEKRSTPEGFMIISKKPAQGATTVPPSSVPDKLAARVGVVRSLSTASRRGAPVPPPTKAQLAALKVYAEKALPPLPPKSGPASMVLSITPPTASIPPPAYVSEKPKPVPSAFTTVTPTKPRRGSLRPRTPKTPNNSESFLSFSATPPRRYSFRAASGAVRTSFLSLTPSPSPSPVKKNKAAHRYSTTSQRMGLVNGALLPPGRVELHVAEIPSTTNYATRPLSRHPYATAVPAPPQRNSRRYA
ncbi:hypothetical protein CALCODRAFT_499153 [Calocera cornea HHB12733]|uniref:Uncharacterized protein n=1 Tax=Calocera cornea HHB12733 TaxID=1353952 RepID=A0A165EIZ1_9BASI|nr:hypothetical protein CALCODRAFT_499153 [Calocera cornea HHB12733]